MTAFPTEAELREAAGDNPDAHALVDLVEEVRAEVERDCRELVWRDDETEAAMARWPARAHHVWHTAPLLWPLPAFHFPDQEWFWRGHFRELLDRAGRGDDLRPATYPEICLLMSFASKTAPLRTDAFGLYVRAWCTAFPGVDEGMGALAGELAHYERMNGTGMDSLERLARDAVARRNPGRCLPRGLVCSGVHWSEPAPDCPFSMDQVAERARPAPRKRKDPAARARTRARNRADTGLAAERAALLGTAEGAELAAGVDALFAAIRKPPAPQAGRGDTDVTPK